MEKIYINCFKTRIKIKSNILKFSNNLTLLFSFLTNFIYHLNLDIFPINQQVLQVLYLF